MREQYSGVRGRLKMELVLALAGMLLTGAVAYGMGIRTERGRHARWSAIQEETKERNHRQGGVVLKRLRISR